MIAVTATDSGNYNVVGTRDEWFVLQGNLTVDELRELKGEVDARLDEVPAGKRGRART